MEYKVVWSPKARQNYFEVIAFLGANWPLSVTEKFLVKTEKVTHRLSSHPFSFRQSITPG